MGVANFHERLYEIVRTSGITQRDFAARMGVSVSVQRNYEKGLNRPNSDYLQRLHEAGYDVLWLLTGQRNATNLQAEENALLSLWRLAPPIIRHAVLTLLREDFSHFEQSSQRGTSDNDSTP